MLSTTDPASLPVRPPGPSPWRRSLLRTTVRTSRLGLVAATVALGSVPLVLTVLTDGSDLSGAMIVLGVVTGASVGWIADDPAAELLAPCPVNAPRRIGFRLATATLAAAAMAAISVGFTGVAASLPPGWTDRWLEALAAAAVALAGGLTVLRRGDPMGGVTGVCIGALAPFVIAALAFRWPSALPSFAAGPIHLRWWAVVAVGGLVAVHAARDTGRGPWFGPTGGSR